MPAAPLMSFRPQRLGIRARSGTIVPTARRLRSPVLNAVDWPEQALAPPGPAFDAAASRPIYSASAQHPHPFSGTQEPTQ